jgi:hypothetical protein
MLIFHFWFPLIGACASYFSATSFKPIATATGQVSSSGFLLFLLKHIAKVALGCVGVVRNCSWGCAWNLVTVYKLKFYHQ